MNAFSRKKFSSGEARVLKFPKIEALRVLVRAKLAFDHCQQFHEKLQKCMKKTKNYD